MQEAMSLSSISLRSDLQTSSDEELRSELTEVDCALRVDDLGFMLSCLAKCRNVFLCQHIPARMQKPTSPLT